MVKTIIHCQWCHKKPTWPGDWLKGWLVEGAHPVTGEGATYTCPTCREES